mgnify:CR=1 FL=1
MEVQEKYFQLVTRARHNIDEDMLPLIREEPANLQRERTPLTELLEFILQTAVQEQASDIHFEPLDEEVRIRMRIKGEMKVLFSHMPLELYGNLVSRFKLICGLDIAEHRLPQDGRFSFGGDHDNCLDVRLSVVPMITGEKIVLRLLNNKDSFKGLSQLDLSEQNFELLKHKCTSGHGGILIAGPVNSGKTTTLYAILSMLNQDGNNIISIEDPVEYRMQGINQIQVNEKIDFTFEKALEAVLRQDFDCLAVGEIRSSQVAETLISAALTGRRIYGTIHTPGAVKTVYRLLDMGIRPYIIQAAISVILGQRLLRKLCPVCRLPYQVKTDTKESIFLGDAYNYEDVYYHHNPNGCPQCGHTGFVGRIGIHEILCFGDEAPAKKMNDGEGAEQLLTPDCMFGTMLDDGVAKAIRGDIQLEDLMNIF